MADACTHHWTVTSPCPFCQSAEIARLTRERDEARAELAKIAAGLNPDYVPRHLITDKAQLAMLEERGRRLAAEEAFLTLRALLRSALPVIEAAAHGYAPPEQSLVARIKAALEAW